MKTTIQWILAAIILLCYTACSDDFSPEIPANSNISTPSDYTDTHISIEEALDNASEAMMAFFPSTRFINKEVESVTCLGNKGTRDNDDGLLYVVNYSNNAGFALLGSDTRMNSVYAISDSGHMELTDTVSDPAFAHFISDALHHSAQSLSATDPVSGITPGIKTRNTYTNKKNNRPSIA